MFVRQSNDIATISKPWAAYIQLIINTVLLLAKLSSISKCNGRVQNYCWEFLRMVINKL